MELLGYLVFAFFLGGIIVKQDSKKKREQELEVLEEQKNKELQGKNQELKELQDWKKDREAKEGKNRELTQKIQEKERELKENTDKNQNAITALKTNSNHKTAINKVEELSNRLRKSIAKIESDFAKRIASFADVGNEPKGLEVINKQKMELSKTGILPNPYMKNPYKEDEED